MIFLVVAGSQSAVVKRDFMRMIFFEGVWYNLAASACATQAAQDKKLIVNLKYLSE
jgi:hypothetical protein